MNTDLSYLPLWRQEELKDIIQAILTEIRHCEFVILHGSYAPANYVEAAGHSAESASFCYDYDILVLTALEPSALMCQRLNKIDSRFFNDRRTPIQFLVLSVQEMNKFLSEGHFYYSRIGREGVCLYDSGNSRLADTAPLDYEKIRLQARQYFREKTEKGESFLRCAAHDYADHDYQLLSFHLHQACESFFTAILLTFTLSSRKMHDLSKLLRITCKYVPELQQWFLCGEADERYMFKMLKKAYKEGRYNHQFVLTEEEVAVLREKVEDLRRLTAVVCLKQLEKYDRWAQKKPGE